MAKITIAPEEVHQAASKFEQASGQSQEIVSSLQSLMGNMQPQWEGMTSQRFYQDYEQWRTSMTQFVELLSKIGTELHAIADRFAAADQQ